MPVGRAENPDSALSTAAGVFHNTDGHLITPPAMVVPPKVLISVDHSSLDGICQPAGQIPFVFFDD